MNIAICISGESRNIKYLEKSLITAKEYCEKYKITLHIFYHIWDTVTKRQIQIKEKPIIEHVHPDYLKSLIQPTIGICQSKDILNNEIKYCFDYINCLTKKNNIHNNFDIFKDQIKLTNNPPYSQLSSMCKSQMLRIEYEEKNNINYDVVIRTRTDVEFTFPEIKNLIKLKKLLKESSRSRAILFFPELWVRGTNNIGVEYCFFIGSSSTLNRTLFQNYNQDISEILFKCKDTKILTTISHNFIPMLIYKYSPKQLKMKSNIELRGHIMGFKQKIHQMKRIK